MAARRKKQFWLVAEDRERAIGHHQLESPAKQEIANQDARLVTPDRIRGVSATPEIASVYHVVM